MAKKLENTNVTETNEMTVEVVEKESKLKNFGSKVKDGVQKHGKKVAKAALGIVVTGAAFALGTKVGGKKSDNDDGDFEAYDVEYSDVAEETTEG